MQVETMIVIGLSVLGIALLLLFSSYLLGIVSIPENHLGVVNKKFVLLGKNKSLPDGKIIALSGEAGWQADTLAPGLYFGYWPWQFAIRKVPFTIIPEGQVGIIQANDGTPLPAGRVLAKQVDCDAFQDSRKFLSSGGERGPQITVIPPGTYRLNPQLFSIQPSVTLQIPQNKVGIVTTKEGKALTTGEIAGGEIPGHNLFQDGQAFINGGGFKGLQEQVMLAGTYYVNPLFISVEPVEMTSVQIGYVGVVVAYVGAKAEEKLDSSFKQGSIVDSGCKGVWAKPLDPGKYPINPYTHKVEPVPTTNIVLNWAAAKSESHQLDKNLSTITVRSQDGFTFNLDVSQIIHISRQSASKVIARFGNMTNLVTQVLEPLIGNYFRNSAQSSDVIEFLRARQARQTEAKEHIQKALDTYDVQAVDTLIGDITPPKELMKPLTDRKVAEQEQITYKTQETAQTARALLNEQTALADTRAKVVDAQRSVEIAELTASATVKTAAGAASARVISADAEAKAKVAVGAADANVTIITGDALAKRTLAVGENEAEVLQKKVAAVGSDNYTTMQLIQQLAEHGIKLVPDVQVSGEGNNSAGLVPMLLGGLMARVGTAGGQG